MGVCRVRSKKGVTYRWTSRRGRGKNAVRRQRTIREVKRGEKIFKKTDGVLSDIKHSREVK